MREKHHLLTLVLICCIFQALCASSFTFSAADVFSVRFNRNTVSKVHVRLKDSLFEADETRVAAETGNISFYVYCRGGGGAVLDLKTVKLGFDFTVSEDDNSILKGWTYSLRSVTDRHARLDFLFRIDKFQQRLELEFNVHRDRSFGIYADCRTLLDLSRNGIRFYAERTLTNVRKTELRLEFGSLFGAKIKINTGEAPVYGLTSREHRTDYEVWFKAKNTVFKAVNVYRIKGDTGTENYTDFSVKLESQVLDIGMSTRLSRTGGSVYAFSPPSVSLVLKITQKTSFGTLGLQIHEDRSIRITLQSEVSHAGAGKFRFTGDIDP